MTNPAPEEDWTRSPARPLGALVVLSLLLTALMIGWAEGRGPGPRSGMLADAPLLAPRLIDVNRATPAELDLLPGIGPKRAAAIIDERDLGGPFRSLDDLERVHGIGPRTVEKLRGIATAEIPDTGR